MVFVTGAATLVVAVAATVLVTRVDRPDVRSQPVAPTPLPEFTGPIDELCAPEELPTPCVELGPGEPLLLGTLLDLSGPLSEHGIASRNGVLLAADYIDGSFDGTEGQLFGRDIEFVNKDERCENRGARFAARDFTDRYQGDVVAVVGTTCNVGTLGGAEMILGSWGIPLVSPSLTSMEFAEQTLTSGFFFRTAHNEALEMVALAEFAREELHADTAATIEPLYSFEYDSFVRRFEKLGGTVVAREPIDFVPNDVDRAIRSVSTSDGGQPPDVVVLPWSADWGAEVIRAAAAGRLGDTRLLVGAISDTSTDAADYVRTAGPKAEGVYFVEPDLDFDNAFYDEEFLPVYMERFEGEGLKSARHAYAFDATMIILRAVEQVAIKVEDTVFIPRLALRNAIAATEGYPGIVGTLTCSENGDCNQEAAMHVRRLDEYPDVFTTVWP